MRLRSLLPPRTALLKLFPAAAGTRLVTPDLHRAQLLGQPEPGPHGSLLGEQVGVDQLLLRQTPEPAKAGADLAQTRDPVADAAAAPTNRRG